MSSGPKTLSEPKSGNPSALTRRHEWGRASAERCVTEPQYLQYARSLGLVVVPTEFVNQRETVKLSQYIVDLIQYRCDVDFHSL